MAMVDLRDRHLRASDVISLVLNPSALTGLLFYFLAARYEPSGVLRLVYFSLCILFASLIPIGLIVFLKFRGKLSDVEMSIRSERERVYLLCAAAYALGTTILLVSGAAWPLWGFLLLHVPNTLLLLAFNRWIKVSIHTMVLTGLYVCALLFFGERLSPLGIIILFAAWARWDAGNHTVTELILGASIGGFLTFVEIYLLKTAFGG
jgi:hypothetical protein